MKTIIFIPNITVVNDIGNQISIQEINNIPNGSCKELLLYDCLDYIDGKQKADLLHIVLNKVRYEGEVIIEGTDLEEVVRSYMIGQINIEDVRKLLYRGNNLSTCDEMCINLQNKGFLVINKRVNNYVYSIRAKRPGPTPKH